MQWLLQRFEDTGKLADALDRLGLRYSWHKVVPFVGDLVPSPTVRDRGAVVLFGSYALWRTAEREGYRPGVFRIAPFVYETVWQPHLLNGADARFVTVRALPDTVAADETLWFARPVGDGKEEAGRVRSGRDLVETAERVLALDEAEIPAGSLRHDTLMMLSEPVPILREWRLWVVNDEIITHSLYREGRRVVYRHEIDDDAWHFGQEMAELNAGYAPAYVMDICRTADGLRLLETNCVNAAGFYAADLLPLAAAIDGLAPDA